MAQFRFQTAEGVKEVIFSQRLVDGCATLCGAALSEQPLAIDLTDLQWLDSAIPTTVAELIRVIQIAEAHGANDYYDEAIKKLVEMIAVRKRLEVAGGNMREVLTLPDEVQLRLKQLLHRRAPQVQRVKEWLVVKDESLPWEIPGVIVSDFLFKTVGCDRTGDHLVLGDRVVDHGVVKRADQEGNVIRFEDGTYILELIENNKYRRFISDRHALVKGPTRGRVQDLLTGQWLPDRYFGGEIFCCWGISPSGRYSVGRSSWENLYVLEDSRVIYQGTVEIYDDDAVVHWSPDESKVLIRYRGGNDHRLHLLYDIAKHTTTELDVPDDITDIAAITDTHLIYSTGSGLRICSLLTARDNVALLHSTDKIRMIRTFVDGRIIVFSSSPQRVRATIYRVPHYSELDLAAWL